MVSLTLWIGDKDKQQIFYIIQCGNENVILELHLLCNANPIIDWATGMVDLLDSTLSRPLEDAETQRYLKQYHRQCEDIATMEKLEE